MSALVAARDFLVLVYITTPFSKEVGGYVSTSSLGGRQIDVRLLGQEHRHSIV